MMVENMQHSSRVPLIDPSGNNPRGFACTVKKVSVLVFVLVGFLYSAFYIAYVVSGSETRNKGWAPALFWLTSDTESSDTEADSLLFTDKAVDEVEEFQEKVGAVHSAWEEVLRKHWQADNIHSTQVQEPLIDDDARCPTHRTSFLHFQGKQPAGSAADSVEEDGHGSQPIHRPPILLVVDSDDGLRQAAPLFREYLTSPLSLYVPVLALTQDLTMPVGEALDVLGLGPDPAAFHCRTWRFQSFLLEELKKVVLEVSPAALVAASGAGLVPELVRLAAAKHQVPHVLVPARELRHVAWLAHLPPEAYRNWRKPTFRVSVITATRPAELQRLLGSLLGAHYLGDRVDVIINMEATADQKTLQIAHGLHWPHGEKIVRHRVQQGGLIAAVTESWYPGSFDEYGILLEDDIEVSPFFFVWCRYALMTYKYGAAADSHPGLFGVSLYTPRRNELVHGKPRWNSNWYFWEKAKSWTTPYVQPLPCSWGAMYFPAAWMSFHRYLQYRMANPSVKVEIKGSLSNSWSASWKKFFMEMSHSYHMYMLYPNFHNQTSFSTNHLGSGEHIKTAGGDADHLPIDYTVPLVASEEEWASLFKQLPGGRLPHLDDLVGMDLLGEFQGIHEFTKHFSSGGLQQQEYKAGKEKVLAAVGVSNIIQKSAKGGTSTQNLHTKQTAVEPQQTRLRKKRIVVKKRIVSSPKRP
mmetsp:Transcript_38396/g.62889  ORF Transcript_38396/g.62889 Transcript_38396/m.62889 type:complete len:694 (+) Transcript_38396:222-2303(+)